MYVSGSMRVLIQYSKFGQANFSQMTHIICRMFDNSTEMLPRVIRENSDNLGQAEGPNRSHVMIRELARETEDKPRYDSFSDVGEIRVYWRADFQSGSRVLKNVF